MLKPLKEGIKIRICIRTFGLGIRKNAFDFNIAFYGRSMVNILIWWVDDKFCRDSRLSHVSCLLAFRVSWYYMRHRRCHLSSTSTYLLLNRMDIVILILLKTFNFYLKIWTFAQRSRLWIANSNGFVANYCILCHFRMSSCSWSTNERESNLG